MIMASMRKPLRPVSYTHLEQEEKRKSELDALQSQINPHFLYNTLDSIMWMIESERYQDAVFMAVSYTHLDVYKRQRLHSDSGTDCPQKGRFLYSVPQYMPLPALSAVLPNPAFHA